MPRECADCPIRRFTVYAGLADDQMNRLSAARRAIQNYRANAVVLEEGTQRREMLTVCEGWALRYKVLPSGQRHILSFAIPGDNLGTAIFAGDKWSYSIQALTPLEVCIIDRAAMQRLIRENPDLFLQFSARIEAEFEGNEQRLVDIARRNADERVARLLLNLFGRLRQRDLVDGYAFPFPLRQHHVADALGLTPIHINRVFGRLRAAGLIEKRDRTLVIRDPDGLYQLAGAGVDSIPWGAEEDPSIWLAAAGKAKSAESVHG